MYRGRVSYERNVYLALTLWQALGQFHYMIIQSLQVSYRYLYLLFTKEENVAQAKSQPRIKIQVKVTWKLLFISLCRIIYKTPHLWFYLHVVHVNTEQDNLQWVCSGAAMWLGSAQWHMSRGVPEVSGHDLIALKKRHISKGLHSVWF